jgi:hypothetical protein
MWRHIKKNWSWSGLCWKFCLIGEYGGFWSEFDQYTDRNAYQLHIKISNQIHTSSRSVCLVGWGLLSSRAIRTRPFRRTRTQTEVRNSDSDSDLGSGLRNRDFPTPWPKIISQWNTYDVLTIVDICACGL